MAMFRLFVRPGEQLIAVAVFVLCLLIAAVALARSTTIDPQGYSLQIGLIGLMISVSVFYRLKRPDERIASATMAVALLLAFTLVMATYNHLLLPLSRPLIDPWLARSNELLSYRWSDWVEWYANYPRFALTLRWVYQSTLLQISAIILALSWYRRWDALDRMMVTLAIGAAATISFWSVFPSISISAFETPSPEALRIVMPVVDPREGALVLDLVRHGASRIAPDEMKALIGFPSFHTILALLCVRFAWPVRLLRVPFLLVNLAMVPAILLHGSHYIVDLFGGLLFFLAALRLSDCLVRNLGTAGMEWPSTASSRP